MWTEKAESSGHAAPAETPLPCAAPSLLLCPHPDWVPATLPADGHAVAHGQVREVVVNGVTLALVAVLAAVILPAMVDGAGCGR